MTDETTTRPPRAEAVAEERRRRRSDMAVDPALERFGVTADILDHDQYVYRAGIDKGMRLHNLTVRDDYDFVNLSGEKAAGATEKGVVRYVAEVVDGRPVYAYLLRKLKRYADEDRGAAARKVQDELKARLSETPEDAPDKSYTPKR